MLLSSVFCGVRLDGKIIINSAKKDLVTLLHKTENETDDIVKCAKVKQYKF